MGKIRFMKQISTGLIVNGIEFNSKYTGHKLIDIWGNAIPWSDLQPFPTKFTKVKRNVKYT